MIYVVIKNNQLSKLFLLKKQIEIQKLEEKIKMVNTNGTELFYGMETPILIDSIYYDDYITYGKENVVRNNEIT